RQRQVEYPRRFARRAGAGQHFEDRRRHPLRFGAAVDVEVSAAGRLWTTRSPRTGLAQSTVRCRCRGRESGVHDACFHDACSPVRGGKGGGGEDGSPNAASRRRRPPSSGEVPGSGGSLLASSTPSPVTVPRGQTAVGSSTPWGCPAGGAAGGTRSISC